MNKRNKQPSNKKGLEWITPGKIVTGFIGLRILSAVTDGFIGVVFMVVIVWFIVAFIIKNSKKDLSELLKTIEGGLEELNKEINQETSGDMTTNEFSDVEIIDTVKTMSNQILNWDSEREQDETITEIDRLEQQSEVVEDNIDYTLQEETEQKANRYIDYLEEVADEVPQGRTTQTKSRITERLVDESVKESKSIVTGKRLGQGKLKEAIILSEVLGKPVSMRDGRY